jgi:hypothetical protein
MLLLGVLRVDTYFTLVAGDHECIITNIACRTCYFSSEFTGFSYSPVLQRYRIGITPVKHLYSL